MRKKLNTESITNELEGASLFFAKSDSPPSLPKPETEDSLRVESVDSVQSPQTPQSPTISEKKGKTVKDLPLKEKKPTNRDTTIPR